MPWWGWVIIIGVIFFFIFPNLSMWFKDEDGSHGREVAASLQKYNEELEEKNRIYQEKKHLIELAEQEIIDYERSSYQFKTSPTEFQYYGKICDLLGDSNFRYEAQRLKTRYENLI